MTTEFIQVLALAYAALAAATLAVIFHDEEEDEEGAGMERLGATVNGILEEVSAVKRVRKRITDGSIAGDSVSTKRTKKEYDYEGARTNIYRDYLGEDPNFGNQFEKIFRITQFIFHRIFGAVAERDTFFQYKPNPISKKGIYPECKVMIALKQLAYGCAPTAFLDYFQMGETTARDSLKRFCKAVASSDLRDQYLRKMTPQDALRVSKLHEDMFGVPGIMGCLDCMHVYWRTCPLAWQGQYKGKEAHECFCCSGSSCRL